MKEEKNGLTRRSFAIGIGGAAAVLGLGGAVKAVDAEPLCRPPGGQDEDHFIATCVRCEKCREACPMSVLKPAKLETGLINARTPTMRFTDNWCDFCESRDDDQRDDEPRDGGQRDGGRPKCVEVCPTQALRLPKGATKENTIIGKAYVRHDWCLGWLLKGCQVCFDCCPYEAIELDDFNRPHVIWDQCNGCGKCEMECVSMKAVSIVAGATHRAITVRASETVAALLEATEGEVE
jgi:ferredoxin-type protein NapG